MADHFNPTSFLDFIPFGPSDDAQLVTETGSKSRAIADYKVLFEDWFLKMGDKDKAKEQALKDLSRVWSVTKTDGALRAMKYAPEAFYSIGGGEDSDWMKAQLRADIKRIDKKIDAEGIMLGSDNQTAREAKGRLPTYPVLVKTPSGAFEELRNEDGLIVRWRPDASDAKDNSVKKALEEAQKMRQEKIDDKNANPEGFRRKGF